MITEAINRIKDTILDTVGDNCEKVILFGSYAYGVPQPDSDYDFYVVLKDGTEQPLVVVQNIYGNLAGPGYKPVDILADYKTHFEERSRLPAIERTIAQKGLVLYDRT